MFPVRRSSWLRQAASATICPPKPHWRARGGGHQRGRSVRPARTRKFALRIVDIAEQSVSISRYADRAVSARGLTTSIVAVVTDIVRNGRPIVGYGFSSIGRFGQSGLIRERFAPRLIASTASELVNDAGTNLDPFRAWRCMMRGEKPGGHGERCVAVRTLGMAIWDAAAKTAGTPLHYLLSTVVPNARPVAVVPVYAAGGYLYPRDDLAQLRDELRSFVSSGYTRAKNQDRLRCARRRPAAHRRRPRRASVGRSSCR